METEQLTPKTQPLDGSNTRGARLDLLVESYEERHRAVLLDVENGHITHDRYVDIMATARKALVQSLLDTYAENCRLGAGFYENLVYTAYRQRLNVLDGAETAVGRIHEDMRALHNAHGDAFTDLDTTALDKYLNMFGELSMVRTIMTGLGLDEDIDRVVEAIVHRDITPKHPGGGSGHQAIVDLQFRAAPVKASMDLSVKPKVK